MRLQKTAARLPYHWLMPLAFFCIGLIYLYATPHFEASDNIQHIGMIYWISERGELPVQSPEHEYMHGQEASQPPLYYLLMTSIFNIFDTSDREDYFQPNPLALAGDPARLGNRNLVNYRQPYPPDLQGTSLALYAMRLVTLGMATVTVAAVYGSARTVMPARTGFILIASALAAFNPQFLFISTSVSNDNLVSMLAALVSWQALLMLRDGFETRRSVTLAILIGLATLSKLSGLVSAPAVLLASLWLLRRTRDWRGFLFLIGSIGFACLLINGWWFIRNLELYGELFGTSTMLDNFGRRTTTVPRLFLEEFEGLRVSYWGLLGAFSIYTHSIYYTLMDLLSLAGAGGLIVFLAKKRREPALLSALGFLCVTLLFGAAMLTWWSLQTTASTGRLLFPYITSISILLALGLHAWRIPALVICLPLFLFSIAAPFLYLIPNYDHPPAVTALPDSATKTRVTWDETTLIGYEIPAATRWSPGDEIPLTLYWQPLAQTSENHALFISLIDADGEALATIDSFPGWGTLPTTWWQPAVIYRDDYIVQIPAEARGISDVQLHIGWYPFPAGADIKPVLESGEVADAFTLPIGAFVSLDLDPQLGADSISDGAVFGGSIKLQGYHFTAGSVLELEWRMVNPLAGDWRAFAIALDQPFKEGAAFEILLQKDATPPARLDYLAAEEGFVTRHEFDVAAGYSGRHGVYIGWYNENVGARLSAPFPSNMLLIADLDFYG